MTRVFSRLALLFLAMVFVSSPAMAETPPKQLYEIRSYILGPKGDVAAIDQYLSEALLPALNRQGIKTVGALTNAENDKSGSARIVLVIPFESADQIVASKQALASDDQYQKAAASYLSAGPKESPYQRISSELLVSMDCWPELKVAEGSLANKDRIYELRLYESSNERLGDLKVDMFNNGEVPIFLDCKIQPIFIGQGVLGPQNPNLTYLTVYENNEAREQAWVAFRQHPDWQVLKKVQKYKGTVSKIDTFIMVPKPYSQM